MFYRVGAFANNWEDQKKSYGFGEVPSRFLLPHDPHPIHTTLFWFSFQCFPGFLCWRALWQRGEAQCSKRQHYSRAYVTLMGLLSTRTKSSKGNDVIGATLLICKSRKDPECQTAAFCFVSINCIGSMTSRNITKLFQVFPFKEVGSVRKLAWVPITLSFLFTWLSLVSSLLNQSLVTYHWLNPEITSGIHCNSAQESSPVDCRAISGNEHFNGSSSPLCLRLCSPSHHMLAHFYPNLRGNRVLQITFPWLKHQIRFYNWKSELQSTICVTSSV